MTIVAILGADTPKMQAIEGLLTEAGVPFVYGLHGGERVRRGRAYRTDGLSGDIPPDAEVWVVEGDGPAIDALRKAGHEVVVIDHHRPGDPGYGRPPAEFLPASSIGQVISRIVTRTGTFLFQTTMECDGAEGEGFAYTCGGWVHVYAGIAEVVDEDIVLTAAADHCLAAAYRGECPGVDPDELMRWREDQ